jgi:adenosine deaminase
MEKVFHWDKAHFKKCNLEAINHSFANADIKEKIRKQIEVAY